MTMMIILGVGCVVVSLWDKFGERAYRPFRAGLFVAMGLSGMLFIYLYLYFIIFCNYYFTFSFVGVIPCIHYGITDGFRSLIDEAAFHWMMIMASLYIGGALLYAVRVPERFFPGKCDIWVSEISYLMILICLFVFQFQSHQIFHMFVVIAAFVHYHGISEMAVNRLSAGSCAEQLAAKWPEIYGPNAVTAR